jgi:hypothetical protein
VNIEDRKILMLGGSGLVGMAVCRNMLEHRPAELQIHALRLEEAEAAKRELLEEWPDASITTSEGDIFARKGSSSRLEEIDAQLGQLRKGDLESFMLYDELKRSAPDVVIDCVNTATGIAYKDIYHQAHRVYQELLASDGDVERDAVESLLEAVYVPRLIRHIQVLFEGMKKAGTRVYVKVGTTGTGGLGLNIPYTHSEERPSRVLLSKSAMAGAQTMLLFLMARTPGAPITKEIKPAAAIAWKKIAHGPIRRKGREIRMVDAAPRPLGETFSSHDPDAARVLDRPLEAAYIDTGENGIFALEEFTTVTSCEQMEFVTPEEIAHYVMLEVEGAATGRELMAALDGAVLGPTYRAGWLRHTAIEQMSQLQEEHRTRSIAFEMLGPPRISKLLFEASLLREAFVSMEAVREAGPEAVCEELNDLVRKEPELANEPAAIGLPVLLDSGEVIRGVDVLVPKDAEGEEVTPETMASWVDNGWVDLRLENCRKWCQRFEKIRAEMGEISGDDTSSRYNRTARFWLKDSRIQPGKLVGWILTVEEGGWRLKR